MKPFTTAFLVLLAAATSVSSQPSEDSSPSANTTRLLGDIPDGTPPPPEPPKPEFIVPAKDILESETHEQGGREITIQKINPIDLPPPPEEPAPIDINDPAVQKRIAARRAKYPDRKLLLVGATVYHSKDTPPRTLVQIWPLTEGKPITLWSSADFSLLSGLPSFTIASGETTSLMMTWSITDIDHINALQRRYARQFTPPKIPVFPSGNATFIVTEGTPTDETLVSIRSLHEIYNTEHDRLLTAYHGREQARIAQEAELKAHPPKPKDITLNYWEIGTATPAKGGDK